MAKWESEILRGELAKGVKREYRKLLSVNISSEEAECLLVTHFAPYFGTDGFTEGRFWMALSLCQWQLGRLTETAKGKARKWAALPENNISPSAHQSLLDTLDAPMPPAKRVRPPAYVSHCPWPVGSLLAYRIISSRSPRVMQSPFYGKYVLLRIVQIKRTPISILAPDAGWNEQMLVGLYNWMGDSIPQPDIVQSLDFTAVSVLAPSLNASVFQRLPISRLSAKNGDQLQQAIAATTTQCIETCCDLDWHCLNGIHRDDVFTYLTCDSSYEREIPPFFKTNITDYSMCNSIPFDAVLVNRFYQLTEHKR